MRSHIILYTWCVMDELIYPRLAALLLRSDCWCEVFSHRRIILVVAAVLAAIVFNTIPASRLTSHLK
jgi:hypothetical protein